MTDIAGELHKIAIEAAEGAKARSLNLKQEYLESERQLRAKKAALDLLDSASERLAGFQPAINGDYQCPICWGEEGIRSSLKGMRGPDEADWFRCTARQHEFAFDP